MGLHANSNFLTAVKNALNGIRHALKAERNLKVHSLVTVVVVVVGFGFGITSLEWLVILLAIGLVWSTELINTAVENTVDLIVGEQLHPTAKVAKDVAAGAVIVSTIVAVLIGGIIFLPRILTWLF